MRTETFTTTKGRILHRPVLTVPEAERIMTSGDTAGFCLACGDDVYCEPDAERCECEACGASMGYGLEQLMLLGMIRFID